MSRVRIALAVGAALVGAIGLPAIQSTASAAATTLYVNNRPGADCTDSGAGTQAAPYCTVGAAAAVAQPGQTVEIQPGTYRESLVVTRSGTAEAPITFRSGGTGDSIAGIGSGSIPGSGITVRGASHLRFEHLVVMSDFDGGVLVDGGRDVSFRRVDIDNGGVRITGASGQVTYAAGSVGSGPGHPPFTVNGGSTGTVVTTNLLNGGAGAPTGLVVDEAPDTVVVSNTVLGRCFAGLVLSGASTCAVVENNVVDTAEGGADPCGDKAAKATGITVGANATAGTEVDYNVVDPRSGGAAYRWAGTAFTAQDAFTAVSGQGAHDFVAPAWVSRGPDAPVNHLIDSADENAPGMLAADRWGTVPVDNPTVANTATGSGIRDRGAFENTDFGSLFTPAGPTRLLDTREAVGVSVAQPVPAWGTVDLPVAGVAGVPATGVTAVTMNVTVTEPTADGHLTVYPHGDKPPTASNLNWPAGRTIPNLVTVPVKDGKVSFYNASGGTVHVIADLAGYYTTEGKLTFDPGGPDRLMDTRDSGAVPAWGTVELDLHEVPGLGAATLNVTVTEPGAEGHLTVYPHGDKAPNASNLNFLPGETIPNQVVVPVKDGYVSLYNASAAPLHLVVDEFGYQAY